jgi:hypothetical protein
VTGQNTLSSVDSIDSAAGPGDTPTPNAGLAVVSPDEVDALLVMLVRRKFDLWYFGQARQPEAIAAVRKWSTYADVFVLRDLHRAAAYRAPCGDPFQPRAVIWTYLGAAAPTLRNILTLPEIDLDLPEYPVPLQCAVPEAARRPMTLRAAR